ncbi:M36 family metallopeptidase [Parvularcula maris]|uniref:M36 family metallopeptidase n=1 Tax=Parvularcula maris TaxID=2965077 RepID=A0A9X2RIC2_9PROT|nr:M36 family metallopeptidase [Parvularcula maris]MCQ8184801.1 M36 family metallopeptidase [Parvularcula maris]
MTRKTSWLAAGASLLVLAGAAQAQDDLTLTETKASTERGIAAAGGDAPGRVKNYLRGQGLTEDAIGSLELKREWKGRGGRIHMSFEQVVDGKRVIGSLVKASADAEGRLLTVSKRLARGKSELAKANISAEEALAAAMAENFASGPRGGVIAGREGNLVTFESEAFFHQAPTAEEVVIATRSGKMAHGWLVTTWSEAGNQLFETVVNAKGKVVSVESRTAEDSYNVFAIHPGVSNQAVVQGPAAGGTLSPDGWLGSGAQYATLISGNNVRAYLDTNNSNSPDTPSRQVTDGNFTTVALLNQSASTEINKEVAVQNLFWLNNMIHDELYAFGFNEGAGNFQENNFGRGGAGSDSVEAQAQDGGGVNNANFATPSDGSNPRMQMYLWNTTNPGRDGDLDGDIVWHEYGHGLTWRMIGSMSGSISGAIGEGMSDVLAIVMTDDDAVGEYAYGNNTGIRRYRYEGYPLTLGNFSGSSVHSDGEIYAATLWDLKKRYAAAGHSRDVLMGDVVDGMNFTAPGPDYLDMRNGILDSAPADRDCLVWESFAAFGMGEGAAMTAGRFSVSVTESFAVPSSCTDGGGGEPPAPAALTALDLTSATSGRKNWVATASLTTDTAGATVGYSWTGGSTGSCTTDGNGSCTVTSPSYRLGSVTSATFTVQTINGAAATSSNGTALSATVNEPAGGGGGGGGGGGKGKPNKNR